MVKTLSCVICLCISEKKRAEHHFHTHFQHEFPLNRSHTHDQLTPILCNFDLHTKLKQQNIIITYTKQRATQKKNLINANQTVFMESCTALCSEQYFRQLSRFWLIHKQDLIALFCKQQMLFSRLLQKCNEIDINLAN